MFAGEFSCKLDDKGRFAVPSSLRERFALPGTPEVKKAVLVKSQQERCLWLFPLPLWYELLEVQRQRLTEPESRLFMHYVVSEVLEVEVDRAGLSLFRASSVRTPALGKRLSWLGCTIVWKSGVTVRG
jgi:MraZ protein